MVDHKNHQPPVWPRIITLNWKAIDQRANEASKAACDAWPSHRPRNQRLSWPWSLQTWKARSDRCIRRCQSKHHHSAFHLTFKRCTNFASNLNYKVNNSINRLKMYLISEMTKKKKKSCRPVKKRKKRKRKLSHKRPRSDFVLMQQSIKDKFFWQRFVLYTHTSTKVRAL